MFAVIKTGGKQYVVKEGDMLHVEKLGTGAGGTVLFENVLLIDDDGKTLIGTPIVPNAVVKAAVLDVFRDDKVLIFKKKRRKQFRRTRGHRQTLAKIQIQKIYPDRTAVSEGELTVAASPEIAPVSIPPKPRAKVRKTAPKPAEEMPAPAKKTKPAKTAGGVKTKTKTPAKKAKK